jgi:hypothetical protein
LNPAFGTERAAKRMAPYGEETPRAASSAALAEGDALADEAKVSEKEATDLLAKHSREEIVSGENKPAPTVIVESNGREARSNLELEQTSTPEGTRPSGDTDVTSTLGRQLSIQTMTSEKKPTTSKP